MPKLVFKFLFFLFLFFIIVFSGFPFYYAIISSFKVGSEIFEPTLWIGNFDFTNYRALFQQQNFFGVILNSIITATGTVLLSLLAGVTASYALGRLHFRGRTTLLLTILGVSMFPQIAVLSGLYFLIQTLGLFNHWLGLSLSYLIFTLPFTVWTLTSFMKSIPKELEESAVIDGAKPYQIVFKILFPVLVPAVVTTGLLAFIAAWNEFLFALTFTINEKSRTIPVAISMFTGNSEYELPFGILMAANVVVTVPVVLIVLIFQRHIISGISSGAVKG
ncbi:MAG: carbohydrate ABC transporter permease [Bdellovibrionota bacterium]